MLRKLIPASLALFAGLLPSVSAQLRSPSDTANAPVLTSQQSGTTNRLQAVSPVSSQIVWASGVGGTWVMTVDGGQSWQVGVVAGAESLQFRDVQGISDKVAYLLSAGTGTDSRIYKTEDGGKSWSLQFQNQDSNAFYDCFSFWTPTRGLATSDSVSGRFPAIRILNGATWTDIGDRLPMAQSGESSFAASGTCLATQGKSNAWIATGGATKARILATTDAGETWNAYDTPTVQGTATSGVFTVAFRDPQHGILGAGELAAPTDFADTVARSQDGGKSWQLTARPPFPGAVYGLSYVLDPRRYGYGAQAEAPNAGGPYSYNEGRVVITGPGGAAWTADEGDTWVSLSGVSNYWAVAFSNQNTGWLVGTGGRILKITF